MNYECKGCHFEDVCNSKKDGMCDAYHKLDDMLNSELDINKDVLMKRKTEFYNEWFKYLEDFYN